MLNKVTLIGNLGSNVEAKRMQSGGLVASFSLATSRKWKDKETGEKKEETEWHRVTFFGNVADVCNNYLKKGSKVYIEGRIKTDKYDKNGVDTYSTKIIGSELKMLGNKQAENGNKDSQPAPNSDFDDDVPF